MANFAPGLMPDSHAFFYYIAPRRVLFVQISDTEELTLIDFPQMVSVAHPNARVPVPLILVDGASSVNMLLNMHVYHAGAF
jgi:hypothetical protein